MQLMLPSVHITTGQGAGGSSGSSRSRGYYGTQILHRAISDPPLRVAQFCSNRAVDSQPDLCCKARTLVLSETLTHFRRQIGFSLPLLPSRSTCTLMQPEMAYKSTLDAKVAWRASLSASRRDEPMTFDLGLSMHELL